MRITNEMLVIIRVMTAVKSKRTSPEITMNVFYLICSLSFAHNCYGLFNQTFYNIDSYCCTPNQNDYSTPLWMRYQRVGNVIKAFYSRDGVNYTQLTANEGGEYDWLAEQQVELPQHLKCSRFYISSYVKDLATVRGHEVHYSSKLFQRLESISKPCVEPTD